MDMKAGPFGQPDTNFGVFVGSVVVADQVDVEVRRDVAVDVTENG